MERNAWLGCQFSSGIIFEIHNRKFFIPLLSSVSSVVHQQICESLDDMCLRNKTISSSLNQLSLLPITKSPINTSSTSIILQRFKFDYFSQRLPTNNYKDICRRRDEQELKREEIIVKLPIVESHAKFLTRQARLKTMKKGQIFMIIESRPNAKKSVKVNFLHQIHRFYLFRNRSFNVLALDNEKHVQCSESPTTTIKENNTRDSSTTSLTRTMNNPSVNLPQDQLPVPIRLSPVYPISST
ncbi:unnamed protein product [Rotaria sordida]|uniref:Uncharacterized protein n=1 Tax=Rotaria sordida TaxID=392033 RepID=A0A819KS25_9BILA|nr:unnamed protein product [Rotaria sordida]CAF3951310.1 unnamed protein product [Rotaria sordida]